MSLSALSLGGVAAAPETLSTVRDATAAEASAADSLDYAPQIAQMRKLYASRATTPIAWRIKQLTALRAMVVENFDELAGCICTDLGRHRQEAVFGDMAPVMSAIDEMLSHVEAWGAPQPQAKRLELLDPFGVECYIQPQPKGVVLIVGPWNFPLTLVLEPLAAALAAGNVVVIKPSEIAPTCSAMLAELVPRYFHASVVQIFEGAVAETTALLRLRWDHIFYTGNPHVGKIVMRAAAAHLTPVTLELGGKSPTVVDALGKVDIATAAKRIAYGKTFNNGQVCIAPDYILVHRSSQAKLVTALKAQFAKMFSETPRDSDSLARMINARHLDRVEGLLVDAHGGNVVLGGAEKIDKAVDPRFIPPTIVVEPSLEVRCSNIFLLQLNSSEVHHI